MYKNDTQSIDGARNEYSSSSDSGSSNNSEESKTYNDNGRGQKDSGIDDNADSVVQVERILSQSLLKLSIVDRNAILEEIHGVRCLAVKENPELIQRSLKEFQKELDRDINENGFGNNYDNNKKAYRLIRKRREQEIPYSNNYAMDDKDFRLRFLRCELFDVEKAVLRFCDYLDYAYEYYGEVALERPIRLADFTETDLKMFRKGYFQFLPFRDTSGRRVIVVVGGMASHKDAHTRDKILFYLFDVATRDSIQSQQRGFIVIRMVVNLRSEDTKKYILTNGDNTRRSRTSIFSGIANFRRSFSSIPSRLVAVHVRIPDNTSFFLMFRLLVLRGLSGRNAYVRPRIIPHSNLSGLEMRYRLKSYGIPTQLLPLTDTNSIKCNYFNQWIKTKKILDDREFGMIDRDDTGALKVFDTDGGTTKIKSDSNAQESGDIKGTAKIIVTGAIVECPGLNDVVFRKGSRVTAIENPGNRFFRDLIRTFLEEKERTLEQLRQETNSDLPAGDTLDRYGSTSNGGSLYGAKTGAAVAEAAALLPDTPPSGPVSGPFPPGTTTTTTQFDRKKNTGKAFCGWLVNHIEKECNGRFLEWNTQICGWIVMRDNNQIIRKVSVTLYNWGKRVSAEIAAAKQQHYLNKPSAISAVPDGITTSNDTSSYGFVNGISTSTNTNVSRIGTDSSSSGYGGDSDTRAFNNAEKFLSIQEEQCFRSSPVWNTTSAYQNPVTRGQKRPRNDSYSCIESQFNHFR